MGDAADYLDDSMLDARLAHVRGECDQGCPWCDGDGSDPDDDQDYTDDTD